MQSRGWGGGRAVFFCVYGLVSVPLCKPLCDIGGQRHFAGPIQYFLKNSVVIQPDYATAVGGAVAYRGRELVGDFKGKPDLSPSAGLYKALPVIFVYSAQQQKFHKAAGILPYAVKAGGDDPSNVSHQHIAVAEIIKYIGKYAVPDGLFFPVVYQQAGCASHLGGGLGNKLLWKVVVKIAGLQAFCSLVFWVLHSPLHYIANHLP